MVAESSFVGPPLKTFSDWNLNMNNNNDDDTSTHTEDVDVMEVTECANNVIPTLYELCLSCFSRIFDRQTHRALSEKFDANSVINLSDFSLTPDHVSLLRRGLTFCPTPGEPSMDELRRDLDTFHRKVKLKSFFMKSVQVTSQFIH